MRKSANLIKKLRKILYRSIDGSEISYKKLKNLLKENQVFLIDVRSSREFEEGHLNGAINIPVYNIEKEIQKQVTNKQSMIILYCSTGHRSIEAKEILDRLGYVNVYNLKDGIDKIWV